jgi:hypothetical protein
VVVRSPVGDDNFTVAFGTTAPVASRTMPAIEPLVMSCACTQNRAAHSRSKALLKNLISILLLEID